MRLPLAAVLLLCACGGAEDEGVVTLRLFLWRPESAEAWDEALERFHDAHPGMRVELEVGPNNSTQLHDLLSQKLRNRDRSVDAFVMDVVWTAEFAAAGWALPLDVPDPEAYFPGTLDAVTHRGRAYGLPFLADAGVLYYRRDLLDAHGFEPPRTWPEMVAQIEAVAASRDVSGFSCQLKQYEGLVCNLLEFVGSNGGSLLEPAAPPAIEAVAFVRDEIVGKAAPRGVLTYEEQESLDLFRTGGAIFHRNWPYAWSVCAASDAVAGRVGMAPLPCFPGGETVSALGGWNLGVSAHSEHPEEARALAAFLAGPEMQKHFAIRAGKPPSRRAPYSDPAVLEANPHFADLVPVLEAARPRPKTAVYPRVSHILQRRLHEAISSRDAGARALLERAAAEVDEALASLR